MKTDTSVKKLTFEIPMWMYNRIAKHLREECEVDDPEKLISHVAMQDLMQTWSDDHETWIETYLYPSREVAMRAAKRYFERYPRSSPVEMTYRVGKEFKKTEVIASHYPEINRVWMSSRGSAIVSEQLFMSGKQRELFADIAKWQGAPVSDVVLTLACFMTQMMPDETVRDNVAELGEGLWKYVKLREIPENNYYDRDVAAREVI